MFKTRTDHRGFFATYLVITNVINPLAKQNNSRQLFVLLATFKVRTKTRVVLCLGMFTYIDISIIIQCRHYSLLLT